ncbi:YegP family protein [Chryseobacterium sp. L7]|uniref:YegP family protein n=1 Tax=Chryseobacterium endalhagicum TaxID=2797638 RepID=A0ABS1QF58_9FLAO|nr:YegP family protein [Chryseobacterium endalhagicum]MBL1221223.1 YegP family protein [Chryseobacterium endalhagicum]
MGKFIISKRTNDDFQFNLKAGNGQVILTSQGYSSKSSCENGIESVRINSQDESKFEKNTAKDNRWYFNLKAGNGQIIGSSQMYESENGMDNGIESVKNNAPGASVEDETNL